MKRFKPLIVLGLVITLLLQLNNPIHAISITTEPIGVFYKDTITMFNAEGVGRTYVPGYQHHRIIADGVYAFCIEPHILVGDGTGYSISDFTSQQQDLFTRIIFHGWERSAKTNLDYVLTQFTIWLNVPGAIINGEQNAFDNFDALYQGLMTKVNSHKTVASFNQQKISLKAGESITLEDNNGVLAQSKMLSHDPNLKVEVNQNKITITATTKSQESSLIQFSKYPNLTSETNVAPLLYDHPINQSLIRDGSPAIVSFYLNIVVDKTGDFSLEKVNEENQGLGGIEFLMSKNEDFSSPISFVTQENGRVDLKDLQPGTYYVKEVNTVEPYVLDETIHQVEIKIGETAQLKFVNKKSLGKIKIIKKDSDTKEPLEGVSFDFLDENQVVLETLTTDSNGEAQSQTHPLGRYFFKRG